jgi:hypothetical protein
MGRRVGVRIVVSTTFSDADSNAGSNIIGQTVEASDAVKPNRSSNWPKFVIITAGLLITLAWTGFLAWAFGKILGW